MIFRATAPIHSGTEHFCNLRCLAGPVPAPPRCRDGRLHQTDVLHPRRRGRRQSSSSPPRAPATPAAIMAPTWPCRTGGQRLDRGAGAAGEPRRRRRDDHRPDLAQLTGGAQPTLYIDDIALASDESPDGPALSAGGLLPRAARADGATGVVIQARVADPQGPADIASVTLDAAALGRGAVALRDDGRSNDGAAADGLYGAVLTVAPGTPTGEQQLLISARDRAGHQASLSLGHLRGARPAAGAIPAALPQRIGWGTNQWSEAAGQDCRPTAVCRGTMITSILLGDGELGAELRHSICESGLEQKLYSGDLGVYDTRRPALERRGCRVIRREAPERDYGERLSGIACASRGAGQGLQAGDLPDQAQLLRLYAGVQIQRRRGQPRRPELPTRWR